MPGIATGRGANPAAAAIRAPVGRSSDGDFAFFAVYARESVLHLGVDRPWQVRAEQGRIVDGGNERRDYRGASGEHTRGRDERLTRDARAVVAGEDRLGRRRCEVPGRDDQQGYVGTANQNARNVPEQRGLLRRMAV